MKLYRPVLIETAEQAEALPIGTWARSDVGGGIPEETVVRTADERQPWRNGPAAWSSSEIVGWTALVPIEAEEEWALLYDSWEPTLCVDEADAREWSRIDGEGLPPSRRLVTPWTPTEEA